MYADYFMLQLGPGMKEVGQKLADRFAPVFKASKGFNRIMFFADYEAGEYGSLALWESKEDCEAFRKLARPQLEQALAGIAKEPPIMKLFEVYEPKS